MKFSLNLNFISDKKKSIYVENLEMSRLMVNSVLRMHIKFYVIKNHIKGANRVWKHTGWEG